MNGRGSSFVVLQAIQYPLLGGGPGRDRTADTWIFSPLLLPAELPGHGSIYKTQKEKIVGFEPTTFCLADKCSTNELNIFLKEKIAVCVFIMVAMGWSRTNFLHLMRVAR